MQWLVSGICSESVLKFTNNFSGSRSTYRKTLNVRVPFISRAEQNREIEGCKYGQYTNFNWHKIVWFEFAKLKGAKINLHVKSPRFMAAK